MTPFFRVELELCHSQGRKILKEFEEKRKKGGGGAKSSANRDFTHSKKYICKQIGRIFAHFCLLWAFY
jgi:hypothetical protein